MEKNLKVLFIGTAVIVGIQVLVNVFYVSPRIKSSLEKLEATQTQLDSARREIHFAHSKVDSIRTSVMKFSNYLITIQGHTEVLYKDRELKDARYKAERDSILIAVEKLKSKIDTISLPTLTLYDSRKK